MKRQGERSTSVSIVIPAYNDADYVGRAIESCLRQTKSDVQVIVVDDGSSDATPAVVSGYAQADGRVKAVLLDENRGTHDARLAGLAQADGKLVLFLDADDEILRETCLEAAAEYERAPFDILQFGMLVRGDGAAAQGQVETVANWAEPYAGELFGRDILEKSFVELSYAFCLPGKAYRTEVVKLAFQGIGALRADFGEDALEYFAVACLSQRYRGLPGSKRYVYHLGNGLSAQADMDEKAFARVLRGSDSLAGMERFLMTSGLADEYGGIYRAHRGHQLDALTRAWHERVAPECRRSCLESILDLWPEEEVLGSLCKLGSDAIEEFGDLKGAEPSLTLEQAYALGFADGARAVRGEYESSPSYRLGRGLTLLPRKLMGRA